MQQAFAVNYVTNGGNATQAAKDAGYSAKSARVLGHRLVNNETVQGLIQRELGKLRYRSGTVGLNALMSITEDPRAPAAARVAAARALLEHSGMIGAGREAGTPPGSGDVITDYNEFLERLSQRRQAVAS
jgi:hypothetical protein